MFKIYSFKFAKKINAKITIILAIKPAFACRLFNLELIIPLFVIFMQFELWQRFNHYVFVKNRTTRIVSLKTKSTV
jgi:hypothetical protein